MAYVIGNWKCNPTTLAEAKQLFEMIELETKENVIICPPFVYLPVLQEMDSQIELGAQDCFWREEGAFTGEVSCAMLEEFCSYVIIGHSERRKLFEDDEMINKKMKAVASSDLTPILCVGETKEQKKQGETEQVLRRQVESALRRVGEPDSLIVGYEPRWAIGSGNPCPAQEAGRSASVIRSQLKEEGILTPVVYGGSVDFENAASYLEFFDGWLIGGASLKPEEFNKIIELT